MKLTTNPDPAVVRAEFQRTRTGLDYPASAALHYAKRYAQALAYEKHPDIEVSLIPSWDEDGPEGHFSMGDDDLDNKITEEIRGRMATGDVWAWASVEVLVTVKDAKCEHCGHANSRHASDYLGGCSYRDSDDFKKGGYYTDMIEQCLDELEIEY